MVLVETKPGHVLERKTHAGGKMVSGQRGKELFDRFGFARAEQSAENWTCDIGLGLALSGLYTGLLGGFMP